MSPIIFLIIRIISVGCIYVFLGLIIYFLWKDLNRSFPKKSADLTVKIHLKSIPDNKVFIIHTYEAYIGRDDIAQIQIDDDSVSNLHARIFQKDSKWWIEDLHSTNGTFLNEERLKTAANIFPNDSITCGSSTLNILTMK